MVDYLINRLSSGIAPFISYLTTTQILVPPRGIEPRSMLYHSIVLPLYYRGIWYSQKESNLPKSFRRARSENTIGGSRTCFAINNIMNNCHKCGKETKNPKYCSRSCSASSNNTGLRRHGNPPNSCKMCGQPTASCRNIYCSRKCKDLDQIKWTPEQRKKNNQALTMRYRARKYAQTPPDADFEQIKEMYRNCPEGYEVDHIIPISKGGLHHQDNLQYLTPDENKRKGNKIL